MSGLLGTRFRVGVAVLLAGAVMAAGCGTRLDREAVRARLGGSGGTASGSVGTGSSGTGGVGDTGSALGTGEGSVAGSGGDAGSTTGTATGAGGGAAGGGAAGTGTGGGAAAASASGPAKYDSGITDTEIKIGLSAPLSGILGFVGEEVVGAVDSYVKQTNERGGIDGRQVKLIAYDDRLDSSLILANTKRLREQDKVFMVVVSLFADSALEYVNSHDFPLMTFGATAAPFSSKYPTVFPLVGNLLTWNQESAYALVNHIGIKPKRVGILYDTTIFDGRGYLKYFKETWERLGAEVVSMDPVNLTDADCTSVALKMRSLNIDWWDFQGLGWLLCASAMDRIGWRPSLGMGGATTSVGKIGQIVGPIIDGMLGGNQGDQPTGAPRQKTAAHDDYVNAIAKYHPNLNNFADLESPATVGFWLAAKLTLDALKNIGPNFTRKAFIDWLHNIKDYDAGIQPPIKSLAADCKRGSGVTWWAIWKYDPATKLAVRTPGSPYVGGFWADLYGGPCYVTKIADEVIGYNG